MSAPPGTNVSVTVNVSVRPWEVGDVGTGTSATRNSLAACQVPMFAPSIATTTSGWGVSAARAARNLTEQVHGTRRSRPASVISARGDVHANVSSPERSGGWNPLA